MPTSESSNKHFVMCYSMIGLRYVGMVDEEVLHYWSNPNCEIVIKNPKVYVERQAPNSPPQIEIFPLCLAATRQKELRIRSEFIGALEDLGVISDDGESCFDSSEFFNMYKDAIARWNARLAHVVAPTGRDIGKVTGGKEFSGPIRLR